MRRYGRLGAVLELRGHRRRFSAALVSSRRLGVGFLLDVVRLLLEGAVLEVLEGPVLCASCIAGASFALQVLADHALCTLAPQLMIFDSPSTRIA